MENNIGKRVSREKTPKRKLLAFVTGVGLSLFGIVGAYPLTVGTAMYLKPEYLLKDYPEVSYALSLRNQNENTTSLYAQGTISSKERDNIFQTNNNLLERIKEKTPDLESKIEKYHQISNYSTFMPPLVLISSMGIGFLGLLLVNYSMSEKKKTDGK